ncbi:uncharacterized protein BDV14DRAFT_119094 [Aspergillus stella-maris]|uniref:uncharacterized protein n=1 Tax=Aspergillus stella-maris TaxID=1810926 RepID=UPI003CCCFEAC
MRVLFVFPLLCIHKKQSCVPLCCCPGPYEFLAGMKSKSDQNHRWAFDLGSHCHDYNQIDLGLGLAATTMPGIASVNFSFALEQPQHTTTCLLSI